LLFWNKLNKIREIAPIVKLHRLSFVHQIEKVLGDRVFRKVSIGLIIFASVWGCAERQRLNPLDPLNPRTKGRITGLWVVSEYRRVKLGWDAIYVKDFLGYNILRRSAGEAYQVIARVAPDSSSFVDTNVEYGVTYFYRVSAVTAYMESPPSDSVVITPGPSFHWVSYGDEGRVTKLTSDARHVLYQTYGLGFPFAIGVDVAGRGVWVVDYFLGYVHRLSAQGKLLFSVGGFRKPRDVAVDTIHHEVWIADTGNQRIVKVDSSGRGIFQVVGFRNPVAVDVHQASGTCWVADPRLGAVVSISRDGSLIQNFTNFLAPRDLSVYQKDGSLWVADSLQVVRMSPSGVFLSISSHFEQVVRLAVDQQRGDSWLIERTRGDEGDRIHRLAADGSRVLAVSHFSNPQSLSVDRFDGSCLVADTRNYRVVKLSADGQVMAEWKNGGRPWWVQVGY